MTLTATGRESQIWPLPTAVRSLRSVPLWGEAPAVRLPRREPRQAVMEAFAELVRGLASNGPAGRIWFESALRRLVEPARAGWLPTLLGSEEAVATQIVFEERPERLPVRVVLVQRCDRLHVSLPHEIVDDQARLPIEERHAAEDESAPPHDRRALLREQERNPRSLEIVERRDHRHRALGCDDREHPVLLDELLCVGDRAIGAPMVVVVDRANFPPVNAAGVVQRLHVQLDTMSHVFADDAERPGQRARAADENFAVADGDDDRSEQAKLP